MKARTPHARSRCQTSHLPGRGGYVLCSTCSGRLRTIAREVIGGELGTLSHSTSAPARTVARFDRVALAQAASPAPPRAARIVPRAAVGLFYVLLEDARLLLAVVICVREPSQNSAAGHASAASAKAKGRGLRAIYVESAVAAVPRDAARIIAAPSAIPSLYFCTFSQPAAPTAPRARASATAPAAVERADEALLDARLGLAVVVGDVKPNE